MYCKDCGHKLDPTSKMCKNCHPDSRRSNKNSGSNMWKIIAISSLSLILVIGIGLIASLFISSGDAEEGLADGGTYDQIEDSGESTELVSTDLEDDEADEEDESEDEAKLENERLKREKEKLEQELSNKDIMHENELLKERIETMNRRASNQSNYNPNTGYYGNTYRITWDDLNNLTKSDIEMLRNEIYARNGYIFSKQPFINYFGSQSWYYPNSNFHEGLFNSVEKANIDTLVEYESYHGWR